MIYTVNESVAKKTATDSKYSNFASILYESEQNDMAIFEAALACDFHEVKGLQEGTILQSEVAALTEANMQEMLKTVKNALIRVRDKILELIEKAIDYIGNYIIKDGKKLVERWNRYKTTYPDHKYDIELMTIDEEAAAKFTLDNFDAMAMSNTATDNAYTDKADPNEILSKALSERVGQEVSSASDFKKVALGQVYKKVAASVEVLDKLAADLSSNTPIKSLRAEEHKIRNLFDTYMKDLDKRAKKPDAAIISAYTNAFHTVIHAHADLNVKIQKERMRLAHRGLNAAMASIDVAIKDKKAEGDAKNESVEYAFDCLLAESEFEDAMEMIPGEEPIDPEHKDAVDALVASAAPEEA